MRIAVVTNILTPYRMRFYKEMHEQLTERGGAFKVYAMTKELPLRPWNYETLKEGFTELLSGFKLMYKGEDCLINCSIRNKLRDFNPNVIILAGSWTYPTSWLVMLRKFKKTQYFFWTESHNVRAYPVVSKSGFLQKIKTNFYMKFDGFCVPGRYATDTLNFLIGNHGIRVRLPNLVDGEYYSEAIEMRLNKHTIRKMYNLPLGKRIFVTPARLISLKGIDLFLKQLVGNNNIKEAVFVLAGEGPLVNEIRQLAKENDLDVRLLGYCNQQTVRDLYAAADFFLLPSLQDANPLTVIEAAFAGLPLCISKYVGNSPELCIDRNNGVIFDTVIKTSVSNAFDFVMKASDSWIKDAGNKAHSIAQNDFSCRRETKKFIDYLTQYHNNEIV